MSLTFGEKQPFRIWFDYLKTCLNDQDLNKKINRNFYKEWNLNLVKNQKFDKWFKNHEHLFVDTKSKMIINNNVQSKNTILIEIPLNYTITKIQREIGKLLNKKINKKLSKFNITSNRSLILPPLDYFLYAWKMKKKNKNLTLEKIWDLVNEHIMNRQKKIKKLIDNRKLRHRFLMGNKYDKEAKYKAILISRNIKKAQKILENVCEGIFTGNYADN